MHKPCQTMLLIISITYFLIETYFALVELTIPTWLAPYQNALATVIDIKIMLKNLMICVTIYDRMKGY